jgi:hypothetical protein
MNIQSNAERRRLAEIFGDAWRYWEPRRLAYNGVLMLGALGWLVLTWPHFQPAFNVRAFGALLALAILANVCYSAIYLAEFIAQLSPARAVWLRWRGTAWVLGTLLALVLEMYWIADEIYPHPQGP